MTNLIKINQTFHGYDEGHNLLAASMQFPLNVKRILRVMSDMSGTTMLPDFEEYITGYPIKEINMYAIAKTWYAPEMRREGCVWTHTLLIDFADLIHINNFKKLISLFKNPSDLSDLSSYNECIELNEQDISQAISLDEEYKITKNILNNLYSYPNSPLLISSSTSQKYESIILSIWAQQWPRLKRNFLFCTGSLTPRFYEKQCLDIQIIPNQLKITNTNSFLVVKEGNDESTDIEWLNILYEDIITPRSILRNFLNMYGSDVKESRDSVIPLITLYRYLENRLDSQGLHVLINYLGEKFPSSKDANNLKLVLLSNKKEIFDEEDILFELATTNNYNSFNYEKLEFEKRFIYLYKTNENITFSLIRKILRDNINPLGEKMIQNLSMEIASSSINVLNKKYRDLLSVFIVANPYISYSSDFWEISSTQQLENFNLLKRINPQKTEINWERIVHNMLNNKVCIDKDVIVETIPNLAYNILNWFNNTNNSALSHEWILILKENKKEVLDWLEIIRNKIYLNTLELIISILNPNSNLVKERGVDIWLNVYQNNDFKLTVKNKIQIKSFFFALAMNFSSNSSIQLLSYSFDDVYKAGLDDNLDYYSWQVLEPHTKSLSFFQDWDKCKKLRRAIVDKFIDCNWNITYLSQITKDKELLKELYRRYKKKRK